MVLVEVVGTAVGKGEGTRRCRVRRWVREAGMAEGGLESVDGGWREEGRKDELVPISVRYVFVFVYFLVVVVVGFGSEA